MSDNLPDLPEEIISDILLRLPAKSIGRSRCVSKPWLSLLTSYDFIKSHLAHHSHFPHEQNLLLHNYRSLFNLNLPLDGNHLRNLEFFNAGVSHLVGSCNGLVLVKTRLDVLCLINCLTQECFKLPVLPSGLDPRNDASTYGFGYDSLSDDYKIVSISQCNNHTLTGGISGVFVDGAAHTHENENGDSFVDIYSLKIRSWRRFGTCPYNHSTLSVSGSYGVLVNGALHWPRSSDNESPIIVAFDLSCEKFYEIPAPASIDISKFLLSDLMVIDGCLGIAGPDMFVEIWFMKSYSLVESWTKLVIDMRFADCWYSLCFHKGRLLFSEDDWILKWYYLQDKSVEVCVSQDEHDFEGGITYAESLVSPHFNYHNSKEKGGTL